MCIFTSQEKKIKEPDKYYKVLQEQIMKGNSDSLDLCCYNGRCECQHWKRSFPMVDKAYTDTVEMKTEKSEKILFPMN